MQLFSRLTAVLLLPVLAGCNSNLTGGQAEIKPSLKNRASYVREIDASMKRSIYDSGDICGTQRVIYGYTNHEGIINDDFYGNSYDDIDDAAHPEKILGGNYVTYGEVPWQATILYNDRHECSGVIISWFWVLSAAHCFFNKTPKSIIVVTGDHHLRYQDHHERRYEVEKIIPYGLYKASPSYFENDIALVKIKREKYNLGFEFNDFVQPVCLATSTEKPHVGTKITISGWGYTTQSGGFAKMLKKTSVPVMTNDNCQRLFQHQFSNRVFCVGYIRGATEICEGDSGAPATARIGESYVLVGIVAFGQGCDPPIAPSGVLTIAAYRDWIDATIKANSVGYESKMPRRKSDPMR